MKIKILCALLLTLLLASCGEYNKILKSRDAELKYTYAKKYFDEKKYGRTTTLLEEILSVYTGSAKEQEILFLLAQAYFYDKDYVTATQYYTRYYNKFPKGDYTELARFNAAYGLYLDSPDARLDQGSTVKGIQEFQNFLEYFPQSEKAPEAQDYMFKLQEKLAYKDFLAARLYYNLGLYMGNNYEACIVTSREALKSYPFSEFAEEFQILIVRARYELAYHSVEEKKPTRYRDLLDEHFNYKNMFPSGKYLKESEKYYRQALKALGQEIDQETNEAVQQELSK
ncbi:outer membrane protein assembly factor BamD [Dysgonomonas sp. PFB1-18]|uniref:outer membrane protein assembly factor BamD n=1 Tax=unclassified Dysgonomonas TaxID=2630389 RepID=UPI0024749740|nr:MULTISPECIES: outer membrane protein assembly factor BamD [unclassified Dysgonomonas]MDH6308826.1 outer membrane protein assembly factor BamD [Dysgonomonas sp. PF1-14]MDH6338478.1 outer membrane protein assembly factor BamD [Dysgonomonas sp. PF1-16]MDH6380075.1 outer membrane protein assembly factor BamD [Dysgonomonas sp. PFB1-18]MDH6397306.1 outer membrane protein assembly factor BamD [Dysgonomonas sp. PF1-23]